MALALAIGLEMLVRWRNARPSRGLTLALSALLLGSLAWAGHAVSGVNHRALHLGADLVHLIAAAVWPAGLVPLFLFLSSIRREPWPPSDALFVLRRFSSVSLAAVIVLFLTGLANACFLLPSVASLFSSDYGRLLLGKIVLFLLLIGLGALNRGVFLQALRDCPTPSVFDRLRRVVLIENGLALLLLTIVGAMGMTPPPS
jgi:putative copper resistance protein D